MGKALVFNEEQTCSCQPWPKAWVDLVGERNLLIFPLKSSIFIDNHNFEYQKHRFS
jgi:hypothetical protein